MTTFSTKDSGQRQQFDTGAQRDTQDGKPRFDLIPLDMLDLLNTTYGGHHLSVDNAYPPIVGAAPSEQERRDLIPDLFINRLAALYGRGALKYDDNNWQKGIPLSRVYASMLRHTIQWFAGDTGEDHLAAIAWNAATLMWTETAIVNDLLPTELADAGPLKDIKKE